jgi:DNA-binding beta-propeller fold protein YncE
VGARRPRRPFDISYTSVAVQPTTGLLWIIASGSRVLVVDPNTRQIVRELRPGGYPQGIAFAASGVGALGNGQGWIDFVR